MFGEPAGAGGAGGSGAGGGGGAGGAGRDLDTPHVVSPRLFIGPGAVFMWQLPLWFPSFPFTHSHALQVAWAVHALQQSAADVVLAQANAV